MIAFINGNVEYISMDSVVVDVNGFGVRVFISPSTAQKLPNPGETVKLFTHMAVKEDDMSLYGFLTRDELELFKKLITVSGIGPKGGLSLLSTLDINSLVYAIQSGDAKALSKAPGIGLRTAERIVIDLKGKKELSPEIADIPSNTVVAEEGNQAVSETVAVLTEWGYSKADSLRAVNAVAATEDISSMDSGKLLKLALKKLS